MGYGLKRLLEIKAEREARKKEREKIRAEKLKQKKIEKRLARKKRLKKKNNQKYYAKVKKSREEYHNSMGDEWGAFSIHIMANGKRKKYVGYRKYKVGALQMYYDMLEKNKEEIKFPQTLVRTHNIVKPIKYELIMLKKIDENVDDNISMLRNEDGKFVKNCIVDSPDHKIILKNEWLVEETFQVYGYDPQRDRKDVDFIINEIILKHSNSYGRLMVYSNKLIFHYDDDFSFVKCKNTDQAIDLYNFIEKNIDNKKYPHILFMGKIERGTMSHWILDEMENKTGWTRFKCTDGNKSPRKKK